MSKSLIIVESPAKTKTLKNFLGASFDVQASMGHIRDLPKSKMGVDPANNFEPDYIAIPERREVIKKLRAAAKDVDMVYLATDPDREGEAIAWHIRETLKLKNSTRIRFNEITKSAVQESLAHPTDIDSDLVNAQQARRVLDRLVGYELSPLLWRKVKRNLSAGRVQSVAVRIICDREREIQGFVKEEYWTIAATLTPTDKEHLFKAKLALFNDEKAQIGNEAEAKSILDALQGAEYVVKSVEKSERRRNPSPPFITSTLQQEASRKLGFGARRTMLVAQQLYEGIEIGSEGPVGLITYMRTDSTRVAAEAQAEARKFIAQAYGKEYMPKVARQVTRKGAQDAHEAIRPTSIFRRPEEVQSFLAPDQLKLYRLVWQRFAASQMAPAVFDVVSLSIAAKNAIFRSTGSTAKFTGFMKVYTEGRDEDTITLDEEQPPLPELKPDQHLDMKALDPTQHFTEPLPRYTEATLVRTLEEKGIGRPSTYATIISTIQDRKYVELVTKKFVPTELGFVVTDQLVKHFPEIMDVAFTANVEAQLDSIEEGKLEWVKLLADFYGPFEQKLKDAAATMERVRIAPKETDEVCPNCGKMMVIRDGRFGEFMGCSGYPDCKTAMPLSKKLDIPCPLCGDGEVVERYSKKKRIFYGCNRYPECAFVTWDKPTNKKCPTCAGLLGEHRFHGKLAGYRCTTAGCEYAVKRGNADEGEQTQPEAPPSEETE